MAEARERDAQVARGEILGPLHGLPQAIKDLAAAKGLPTTMGSPLFRDTIAPADALFVERMRNAGAIIIGKTNVPEFGLGSQTFNPVFGATRNPYDLSKTPGGSSGGAGAALAMRMLPVADGSDHGGSLRNPAAFNNLFALRPTYGRVPNADEDAFIPGFSVTGPMARNIPDLQMLLAVQSGYDARQPYAIPEPHSLATAPLDFNPRGKRVAWLGDFGGHIPFEAGVLELCRGALRTLEGLGCIVEDVTPQFDAEKIFQNWATLRSWVNWKRIAPLYADPEKRKQLKPEALWEFERCLKISGIDVRIAAGVRTEWYQVVRQLFERYDYLVLPSAQVFPFDVRNSLAHRDRRQEDGHLSSLDGGDDPGHHVRLSGDRRPGRFQRARPADGDADRRPDASGAVTAADRARLRPGDAVGDEGAAADVERGGGAVTLRRPILETRANAADSITMRIVLIVRSRAQPPSSRAPDMGPRLPNTAPRPTHGNMSPAPMVSALL